MTRLRDPSDPWEWIRRARSNLARARSHPGDPEILYEDLCFDAQQAAEKAIKAIFISRQIDFPPIHSIADLLTLLDDHGLPVPEDIRGSIILTQYAVATRYPRRGEDVTPEQHEQAIRLADGVVKWAEESFRGDA